MNIYYNERGRVDGFATYINNHEWTAMAVLVVAVILAGIVEAI